MANQDYINELIAHDKQSMSSIQSHNLKDRFKYPYLPTMVIDNFYDEPDLVRDYALGLEFFNCTLKNVYNLYLQF